MKKFLTYLLALAALFTVAISCNDEEDIKPGEPDLDGCFNVYFPVQEVTGLEIEPSAVKELEITAVRENTYGAISVPLELTDDFDGIFSVDDLVFADGQSETVTTLYFENAEIGVDYSFAVQVTDPQYASYYGENVPGIDVSLAVVKWNLITETEKAKYTDDFITSLYGVDNVSWEVDVEERDDMPGLFRILYPYDGKYIYNDPGDWDESKDYNLVIDASDPDGVFIEQQEIGMDWGYGIIYVESLGWYYYVGGNTWDAIKEAGYCGTYKNGIITFPTSTLLVCEPGYSSSLYYANNNGAFKLVLPGAIETDYSVSIDSAVADGFDVTVSVTLGEDVEYARVGVYEGTNVSTAVSAIQRGSGTYETITASGEVTLTTTSGGKWSVVAVTFDEDDEAQESASATVKIVDPNETWSFYGYGDYHYGDVVFSGDDPGLEIYQSDSDEDRFKLTDWGYGVDFVFTWDQSTNEVVVEDQPTGYSYGFYGMIYIDDVSDYYGISSSTYSNGTFYFSVVYYDLYTGSWGFGVETLTLTDGAMYSLSDLIGTYFVDGASYFGADYDVEGYPWVIEASDDPDWDIMLTYFNSWPCDTPLYGNFDTSTGVFTIYSGTKGQYFYNYYNMFDIYFVSYNAMYYSRYGYDSGEFQLLPNGTFVGPLEADLVGEYLYDHGTTTAEGWNQLFEFVYGEKYSSATNLFSASAPQDVKKEAKVINKKVDRTSHTLEKVKIDATVKMEAKNSSADEETSSKFSKKVLRNPAPASLKH